MRKSPDCKGIDVQDFSRIDWSQVNLDEWLAILYETGHFPTQNTLSIDDLTGNGSRLYNGTDRANAASRGTQRSTGINAEQTRKDAEGELWNDALPNLP